jgi:hypothetical protein
MFGKRKSISNYFIFKYLKRFAFLLMMSLFFLQAYAQKNWEVSGTIKDTAGKAVEHVNIIVINTNISTSSDKGGNFNLSFSEKRPFILSFSGMNFKNKEIEINPDSAGKIIEITLEPFDYQIGEVTISNNKTTENGLIKIESKLLNSIPSIGGDNIQVFIKTMPGVASGNELSSNYSVRGGNFDENLVYINDIEIFRPALLQSGQQEGLNMANPDLVSKIDFSPGGFSVIYDDKMSSVLDIKYRKPDEFKAGSSISLLGASTYFEGNMLNKKFTHLTGIRYKNAQYLLKSLETNGEYRPNFFDFQSILSYHFNNKLTASFLGYYANNNFLFFPEDRITSFGTISEALSLYVDFNGNEKDNFTSAIGSLSLDYKISDKTHLKWGTAIYNNNESLTYDIEGRYSLNQLDKQLGSSTFGDSILNLGIGRYLDHARSYYNSRVFSFWHNGWSQLGNNYIQWGIKYQHELYSDKVNEWKMIDSAGYSIPNYNDQLALSESWFSNNTQNTNHLSAYIHSVYHNPGDKLWNIDYGIRYSLSSLNNESLLSPRISIGWYPQKNNKLYLRMGGGLYYQSIVFREIIDRQGNMHPETKTPYSIQYTASGDYDFKMMGRPFHFKAEIYYKRLFRMIPYSVDNIKNVYYPGQTGNGYASGIDFRLNGEFVKDVESWLSVSLMKSGIDIDKDTLGMQPLPNDHLVNVSLYFQDYVPGNKRFKMYLAMFYLSGRPFGPPNNDGYYAPLRIADYKRVDIGFSVDLKPEEKKLYYGFGKIFKQVLLNLEVFNLLGINNIVSYNWIKIVPNSSIVGYEQYSSVAVPNRLSARRFNIRLLMSF